MERAAVRGWAARRAMIPLGALLTTARAAVKDGDVVILRKESRKGPRWADTASTDRGRTHPP